MRRVVQALGIACTTLYTACGPSLVKQAAQLQEAGMNERAAELYLQALQKKPNNPAALAGLKVSAGRVLEEKLERAAGEYRLGNNQEALELYSDAFGYQERVGHAGVSLVVKAQHAANLADAKESRAKRLYDEGLTLLEARQYADAERILSELKSINASYNDANTLWNEAVYQQGLSQAQAEQWRTAYQTLGRVGSYKQALQMREKAVESGRITVAVTVEVRAGSAGGVDVRGMGQALYSGVLGDLTNRSDPFVSYVNRTDLAAVERERLSSSLSDASTEVELGRHFQARYLAKVVLSDVTPKDPPPERESQKALEWTGDSENYTYTNSEGKEKTRTRPKRGTYSEVTYFDYRKEREVAVTVSVEITDVETSALMPGEVFSASAQAEADYSEYSGDYKKLYRYKKNSDGEIKPESRLDEHDFQAGAREINDLSTLGNEAIAEIVPQAASKIAALH